MLFYCLREVYHLSSNKEIIVMCIANDKTKEVIQNIKSVTVKHEPPVLLSSITEPNVGESPFKNKNVNGNGWL